MIFLGSRTTVSEEFLSTLTEKDFKEFFDGKLDISMVEAVKIAKKLLKPTPKKSKKKVEEE